MVESGSNKHAEVAKEMRGKKIIERERVKNLIITTNSGEPVAERVYSILKRKLMCSFYLGDGKIR